MEPSFEPRLSSTVVLVRDSPRGPQVLLTQRPAHLRFMGGATVFPGGAVAAADVDERWTRATARSAKDAAIALAWPEDPTAALGVFVTALRESFEEVGLPPGAGAELDRELASHPDLFLEGCLEAGVVLRTDELFPAGRWVTPAGSPIRFDTHFFVMRAPAGWEPEPDPAEVDGVSWATPAEALTAVAAARTLMAPPTIEMLQRLDGYATADELLRSVAGTTARSQTVSVRLSPLVHVVIAPNPGLMTGPGTNTYVVGTERTCVIDPAVDDPSYLDSVREVAGYVESILVTHRHSDHIGGAAALAESTGAPVRGWGPAPAGEAAVEPIRDGDIVRAGGVALRALHTPGHSSDHLSFHLEGAASLFAGDNILGEGTAVIAPPDGDMGAYLASLDRLLGFRVDRIYPGHWHPLDGGATVIRRYIDHRLARERQIVAALSEGAETVEQVVARAYADTPVERHGIARFSTLAHLEHLEGKGIARRAGERWSLTVVE